MSTTNNLVENDDCPYCYYPQDDEVYGVMYVDKLCVTHLRKLVRQQQKVLSLMKQKKMEENGDVYN